MAARPKLVVFLMATAAAAVIAGWFLPFSVESRLGANGFEVFDAQPGIAFVAEPDPVPGLFERATATTAALASVVALLALPRYERFSMPLLTLALVALYTVGGRIREHALDRGLGTGAVPGDDRQLLQPGTGFWLAFAATAVLLAIIVANQAGWLRGAPSTRGERTEDAHPPTDPSAGRRTSAAQGRS
jgi:hypothetical protein